MYWELLSSVRSQNAKAHLGANLLRWLHRPLELPAQDQLGLSATCNYLVQGQKVANHHCKDLVLLSCASGTANWNGAVDATCAWIWQFSLGDICCTRCITMLERESRRDSHWRQPWTSDSLALGSEIKIRNHPIGRATDIFPCLGCFMLVCQNGQYILSG